MPALEQVKRLAEKATGWRRPTGDDLAALVRGRKAHAARFKDDGIIPNIRAGH